MPDPYGNAMIEGGSPSLPLISATVKHVHRWRYVYSYSVWDNDPNLDVYAGL